MGDDVKPEDVTDLALLPRRFDLFASEVRQSFELLSERIMPALTRIEERLDDMSTRIARLERDHIDIKHRVSVLEQSAKKRRGKK